MKRKLFALASALLALSLVFTACGSDDDDSGSSGGTAPTLQALLASAADGSTIDLANTQATIDKVDYTISANNFTLKNGDLKGSTVTVKGKGVTLEKLTNVDTVIIDKAVEESEFYLTETDLNLLTVNGGGANSVYIKASTVKTLNVSKEAVHIVLEKVASKVSRILSLYAKTSCKLESKDSDSVFESVTVAAESVTLAGSAKVETLVTTKAANTVKIESSKVTITAAGTAEEGGQVKYEATGTVTEDELSAVTTNVNEIDAKEALETVIASLPVAELTGAYQFLAETPKSLPESLPADNDGAYTVTIPKNTELWNSYLMAGVSLNGEAGKNYKFYFNVKTDVATKLGVKIRTSFCEGKTSYHDTSAGEWTTFSGYTGAYEEGFGWLALEFIAKSSESAVKLSVKNIRYEEVSDTDDPNAGIASLYAAAVDVENISLDMGKDSANIPSATVTFKSAAKQWAHIAQLHPIILTGGNLYKVTFTVNAKNATDGFATAFRPSIGSDSYDINWAWAESDLAANTDTEVTGYIVYNKTQYAYDDLGGDTDKSAYLKLEVTDTIENTITVKNIKAEPISLKEMTSVPCWNSKYFEDVEGSNDFVVALDTEDGSVLRVPANSSVCGRMIVAADPNDPWNMSRNGNKVVCTTSFVMWDGEKPAGVEIAFLKEALKFTNNTDEDIFLTIEFENFNLHFEVETNATKTSNYLNQQGYRIDDSWYLYKEDNETAYTTELNWTEDDPYFWFKLYNSTGYGDGTNLLENGTVTFGDYTDRRDGYIRVGPLVNGKKYSITITPLDSTDPAKVRIDAEGTFKDITPTNGQWWYYDVDVTGVSASSDTFMFLFNKGAWNDDEHNDNQTGDLFISDAYAKGFAYYTVNSDFVSSPTSATATKPSYTKTSGTVRVYVQAPASVEQVYFFYWPNDGENSSLVFPVKDSNCGYKMTKVTN